MNFQINFDIFNLLRQLINLNLPFSGFAGIMQQFWAFIMNSLRIIGL